jgi:hypothetical protein
MILCGVSRRREPHRFGLRRTISFNLGGKPIDTLKKFIKPVRKEAQLYS